jgi:hypothetical protein
MEDLRSRVKCTTTPTFINQVVRVFAACAAGSALFVEGPPGYSHLPHPFFENFLAFNALNIRDWKDCDCKRGRKDYGI